MTIEHSGNAIRSLDGKCEEDTVRRMQPEVGIDVEDKDNHDGATEERRSESGDSNNDTAPGGPENLGDAFPALSHKRFFELERLEALGVEIPDLIYGNVAENYRQIKRPLINNTTLLRKNDERLANLVMITSALPGEGKTFSSINLAMSIAQEHDHTALLVDADLIQMSITRNVGLQAQRGLIEAVIQANTSIADIIWHCSVPRFGLVPAGGPYTHTTELLASSAMEDLLEEVSRRYKDRIIIIDAPPLLATSEAKILAQLVDQVLVVVEAGKTSQSTVEEALGLLSDVENIGLILNKTRKNSRKYYGYGYGYYRRMENRESS